MVVCSSSRFIIVTLLASLMFVNGSVIERRKGGGGGGGGDNSGKGGGGKGGGGDGGGAADGGAGGAADGGNTGITTAANAKNPKCVPWYAVRDKIMGDVFNGVCGDPARASVRLAFHDCGTFSQKLAAAGSPNGGCDGSMFIDFPAEVSRPENNGLQDIVSTLRTLPAQFNVSNADLLQLAGILGVLTCPGGPSIKFWTGRVDAKAPNPTGLLPDTNDPVPTIIARMGDMGISQKETMALMGAHSSAKQRFVDPAKAGPLDSTVDIWDVRFYRETTNNASTSFHLPSDLNFSKDQSTSKDFQAFIGGQNKWQSAYQKAHEHLSLLGAPDTNQLTDCSEVLPPSIDITKLTTGNAGNNQDPTVDPAKLKAAQQAARAPWLKQ